MKKIILSAFMILAGVAYTQAGVIVIEGNYQGKNLYIQNPYAGSNVGFCTFEVTVNDETTTDEINTRKILTHIEAFCKILCTNYFSLQWIHGRNPYKTRRRK